MTDRDFHALRSHLGLPPVDRTDAFPDDVVAEAHEVAAREPAAPVDRTDLPFVTIDPPGSMDLDQAVHLERAGDGFVVHYAIADLGGAVELDGAIDGEARRRGQTIYLPDGRVPLHPVELSEGALSLLPDQVRAAVLWTVEVDADGRPGTTTVERALVRSVARLDYAGVQADADAGRLHSSIEALPDLGRRLRAARVADGAIELDLPEQEVVRDGDAWSLRLVERTEADGWNAEISLLTGRVAARLMLDAGVGLLRTLPDPPADEVRAFLALAESLGVAVEDGASPGQVLDGLDRTTPESLALATAATRLLRGATYAPFDGDQPHTVGHAGIGSPYAQVTAPLRRLADRFATEVCLAIADGGRPSGELLAALPDVAERMAATDRVASEADRTAVDLVETWVMTDGRDETFDAVVVRGVDDGPAEVMLLDPPVVADCAGTGLEPGARVTVRVASIDHETRRVTYVAV